MKKQKLRKLPVIRSSYERKKNLPGFVMKTPGPYYFGATLHYIDKQGYLKHDSKSSATKIKKNLMTLTQFKKMFDCSEKANPYLPSSKFLKEEMELAKFVEFLE